MTRKMSLCSLAAVLAASLPALRAQAQPDLAALQAKIDAAQSAGDNAWMLTSSALVLMMTGPGLALFYSGLVRKKNVLATMMQSFIMMALETLLWGFVGYSIAFGVGTQYFGDLRYLFLNGVGTWTSDIGTLDGARYLQARLSFSNDLASGASPELSSLGIAFQGN